MRSRRLLLPCLLGLLTLFVTVACSGNSDAIRVASKNFAEQEILGEMYAQVLEANGYTVERKLNLGATDVAQQALEMTKSISTPNTPARACSPFSSNH